MYFGRKLLKYPYSSLKMVPWCHRETPKQKSGNLSKGVALQKRPGQKGDSVCRLKRETEWEGVEAKGGMEPKAVALDFVSLKALTSCYRGGGWIF